MATVVKQEIFYRNILYVVFCFMIIVVIELARAYILGLLPVLVLLLLLNK